MFSWCSAAVAGLSLIDTSFCSFHILTMMPMEWEKLKTIKGKAKNEEGGAPLQCNVVGCWPNPIPPLQLGVNGGGPKASLVTTSLQLDERRLHVPGSGSRQPDIASPLGSNKWAAADRFIIYLTCSSSCCSSVKVRYSHMLKTKDWWQHDWWQDDMMTRWPDDRLDEPGLLILTGRPAFLSISDGQNWPKYKMLRK